VALTGSRAFTTNEVAMVEADISALDAAIGQPIFTWATNGTGDIPITLESAPGGSILGFAGILSHLDPAPAGSESTAIQGRVGAQITINAANLEHYSAAGDYPVLFQTVVLHEMGHVAGLDHDPVPGLLMSAETEATPRVLNFAQPEIASLRLLYGLD
jgi:hypothetical protein